MKPANFNRPIQKPLLAVRNQREDLISQIVEATTEKDKKALAKRLAIAGNTLGWSSTDYHALLKKKDDPTLRNYTSFVKWSSNIYKK